MVVTTELAQVTHTVTTGIEGLDVILHGGYTRGRCTLIRGSSGTGKSIFSLLFAVAGDAKKQSAVFASFDEPVEYLEGYVKAWSPKNKIRFLDFTPDPEQLSSGSAGINLDGLLVRVEYALKEINAKCLILDAFDVLFSSFDNTARVRHDLHKLFVWARERGITLVATAGVQHDYAPSTDMLDYASDCTIFLNQVVDNGLMTRKLRVLKLRGRAHGTNDYPFLIDTLGVSVLPITDTAMTKEASGRRFISTGIEGLDSMLGGKGILQGNTTMISGQSGSGKSLLLTAMAAHFAKNGYKVLYLTFEEATEQLIKDAKYFGIRLDEQVKKGNCQLIARRSVEIGMEEHVIILLRHVKEFNANLVIIDPISALSDLGDERSFKNVVLRLCHILKMRGATVVLSELLQDTHPNVSTLNISSIADTWLRMSIRDNEGGMQRRIKVHKSRGSFVSATSSTVMLSKRGIAVSSEN